jgi:A/G-specific adenine glycosylase
LDLTLLRRKLIAWYRKNARDLPWRRTGDPWAILVSEIMLQQTRVAAVIPYYHRFLARFPAAADLAVAPGDELLAMWAGLGYYSRARNLQAAAREIGTTFPAHYEAIRALPGVGDYTAAAVGSIAFGLKHAAVDGNVRRVMARLTNQAEAGAVEAGQMLHPQDPGLWNQAVMELGATVCLPRAPLCEACPVSPFCAARLAGNQNHVPVKKLKPAPEYLQRVILIVREKGRLLLVPSVRVTGFWDLPEAAAASERGALLGEFRHTITHRHYRFQVHEARRATVNDARWVAEQDLPSIPLSTVARKALRLLSH